METLESILLSLALIFCCWLLFKDYKDGLLIKQEEQHFRNLIQFEIEVYKTRNEKYQKEKMELLQDLLFAINKLQNSINGIDLESINQNEYDMLMRMETEYNKELINESNFTQDNNT